MSRLSTATSPEEVYRLALAQMLEQFGCERALVAHGSIKEGIPKPRSSHAIPTDNFVNSTTLSLSILRQVIQEKKPLCLMDALMNEEFGAKTSAILSGLRSILCVPLFDPDGEADGLLYMDNRVKSGAFEDTHLLSLTKLAQAVSERLHEFAQPSKRVLADQPEFEALRKKALDAFRQEQLDDAETWLMAAREVAQNSGVNALVYSRALNDLGQVYKHMGRLEEARPLLEQALEVAEQHPPSCERLAALNNLAGLSIKEGNTRSGLAYLKRAVSVRGPFEAVRICLFYNLAKVCVMMGETKTGQVSLEQLKGLLETVEGRPQYVARAQELFDG